MTPTELESTRLHRRQTRLRIIVPVAGLVLLLLAAIVGIAFLRPSQISLISDMLLVVLVLCPAVICLLPLYILLMVMAFGLGEVHNRSERSLDRLQRFTRTVTDKTISVTDTVNNRAIDVRSRLAPLEDRIDSAFQQKDEETEENNGE